MSLAFLLDHRADNYPRQSLKSPQVFSTGKRLPRRILVDNLYAIMQIENADEDAALAGVTS
jgi:hypothetical protein